MENRLLKKIDSTRPCVCICVYAMRIFRVSTYIHTQIIEFPVEFVRFERKCSGRCIPERLCNRCSLRALVAVDYARRSRVGGHDRLPNVGLMEQHQSNPPHACTVIPNNVYTLIETAQLGGAKTHFGPFQLSCKVIVTSNRSNLKYNTHAHRQVLSYVYNHVRSACIT